ncbi:MAG TPA: LptF/LptG family permease [Gemmataceae bacterium]|nr:LptF/LptG family permease [Gemmataceae bacterium]
MFSSLIHRMILRELLKIFSMALIALTGLLLMATVVQEASRNGLSPGQILLVIPLLIPSTLPYTLPTTTLFATCVVYGRLAHDNEILAIKAAGINILRVVWPGVLLGIIISVITIGLYYRLIPRTHYLLRAWLVDDLEEFMYTKLKHEGQLTLPKVNYEIYVKRVQGRKLLDAQFMRRDASGRRFDVIARAREAELHVDLAKRQIIVHMKNCEIVNTDDSPENGGVSGHVDEKDWPIEIPEELLKPIKNRPCDMTWQEMRTKSGELEGLIQSVRLEIAAHKSGLALNNAPPNWAQHVQDKENQKRHLQHMYSEIQAEMHQRPALALGCLCFVLVGCPVGIWFSRSDYLSAFITCFLPIVLIYYPILLCGFNAARFGRVPPGPAIWAADVLMALSCFPIYRKLLKN